MCLNRLDICMSHDQVIRDKVEAGKYHYSKVVLLWKKSSTFQWFRLLTVCCQRFTHQSVVFLHCEANAYFIGSGCAGSLSFFLLGLPPSFLASRGFSRAWRTEEKRETARSLGRLRQSSYDDNNTFIRLVHTYTDIDRENMTFFVCT